MTNKKTFIFIAIVCLAAAVLPALASAETRFNMMTNESNTLLLKNETQGTSQWVESLSANAGDYIRFNVYYHCGTSEVPPITAQNTVVRLNFPTNDQTTVNTTAQITSSTASGVTDYSVISVSSNQHLVFEGTAKWYRDNNQTVSDVSVSQGTGSAEVNLGQLTCDPLNCYTNAGYLIFRARLTNTTVSPTVDLKINGSDGTITIPYNTAATLSWVSTNAIACTASGDWSGAKSLSGSESTGNLTSNKSYTISCSGSGGGSVSDNVSVNVQVNAPTVDLKVNGSDGQITIPYNTAATLSWVSTNATSCYGTDTGWSGYKSLSGSESTGNLFGTKTYVISCSGNGGTATDSVTVLVTSSPVLYASLEAIPNSGTAPLNGVDLRATATGTASGSLNYKFDCTSDGSWDYTFNGIYDNPKTVVDACNYPTNGTYIAKVRIEQGTANPAEATAQVVVVPIVGNQDLTVLKTARNLSDNTAFGTTTAADPGEVIEFRILVTNIGSTPASNLVVRDTLPVKMNYYGTLKVDNVLTAGDVSTGLNIGTLLSQQTRTITFQAVVASADNFAYGTTDLTNTALAYNTTVAKSGTTTVQVTKTSVLGVTTVPTGALDSAKIAFLLSLVATLLLSYFLLLRFYLGNKAYVWGVTDVFKTVQTKIKSALPKDSVAKSEERLMRAISEIQKREKGIR